MKARYTVCFFAECILILGLLLIGIHLAQAAENSWINRIDQDQLEEMVSSGDPFFLEISSKDCPWCEEASQILKESRVFEDGFCIEISDEEQERSVRRMIPFNNYPSFYYVYNGRYYEMPVRSLQTLNRDLEDWMKEAENVYE